MASNTAVKAVFPSAGLLPKDETGATELMSSRPGCDGRGVTVAIFDTGVDPGAAGLQKTTTGETKIVDIVDATGSGDVNMKKVIRAKDGVLQALSGRPLKVPAEWDCPSGEFRIGLKRAFDLFPSPLITRMRKEYAEKRDPEVRQARAVVAAAVASAAPDSEAAAEAEAKLAALDAAAKEPWQGPIYDCIVFKDGSGVWRACVDTKQTGELTGLPTLCDYRLEHQYAKFSEADYMTFSVNVWQDGDVLSIVTTAGAHGTHVAGIVAAHYADKPEQNGVAPGAKLVSVKIGDSRLGSMETGTGMVRGMIAALRSGCDLVNMSYGEATRHPNVGRFISVARDMVHKHNMIFLASAGNNGPALSTLGCPGGTTEGVIGVGAYVTQPMMAAAYSLRATDAPPADQQYTWSSRGPSPDGALGVCITAPGGAITEMPLWSLKGKQLMNGTSMSSPNATGAVALVLSGCKAKASRVKYTPASIRRALEQTAIDVTAQGPHNTGMGVVQAGAALAFLESQCKTPEAATTAADDARVRYSVTTNFDRVEGRGVYLREPWQTRAEKVSGTVFVAARIDSDAPSSLKIGFQKRVHLTCTAPWVTLPGHLLLNNETRAFGVDIDTASLAQGQVHYAEIRGLDTMDQGGEEDGENSLGPEVLFRVPITAIVPEEVPQDGAYKLSWPQLSYSPGTVQRKFVAVPEGATFVKISVTTGAFDAGRRFLLHMVQLLPSNSCRENQFKKYVAARGQETHTFVHRVRSNHTLEVCLAQFWSSLGASTLDLSAEFISVSPSCPTLGISGTEGEAQLNISALFAGLTLEPQGKLTHRRRALRPEPAASVRPLCPIRDILPDGRRTHELELTYKFSVGEKCKVRPMAGALARYLYECAFEAQLWVICDSNGRACTWGDAFPPSYAPELEKGSYTLRLSLRHDDPAVLSALTDAPLQLETPLAKPMPLSVRVRPEATGARPVKQIMVSRGATRALHVGVSMAKVPQEAAPGDMLVGALSPLPAGFGAEKCADVPVELHLTVPPPTKKETSKEKTAAAAKASKKKKAKDNETLEDAERDLRVKWLGKLSGVAYSARYTVLAAQYPDHLPLHAANLKNAKAEALKRKQQKKGYSSSGGSNSESSSQQQGDGTDKGGKKEEETTETAQEAADTTAPGEAAAESAGPTTPAPTAAASVAAAAPLPNVEAAADAVISAIDTGALASHYGVNVVPGDDAAEEERARFDKIKACLVDALQAKFECALDAFEALAPDADSKPAAARCKATYQVLCKWSTIKDDTPRWVKYMVSQGNTGKALDSLTKQLGKPEGAAKKELWECREQLFGQLGWSHLLHKDDVLQKFPPKEAAPLM